MSECELFRNAPTGIATIEGVSLRGDGVADQ
jgi:hypothetical protein